MVSRGVFFVGILLSVGLGCARRAERVSLPNLLVPVTCASEITLLECDARVRPPKCKKARVTYRVGCEQVVVARK